MRGTSFRLKTEGAVDRLSAKMVKAVEDAEKNVERTMGLATNLVYRTARAKRPYISVAQAKSENRGYRKVINPKTGKTSWKIKRVSDPNAELGVPVREVNGGTLQASIQKDVKRKGKKIIGTVWTDNPYAKFLEFGTSKMAARPFLRAALVKNWQEIQRLFNKKKNNA